MKEYKRKILTIFFVIMVVVIFLYCEFQQISTRLVKDIIGNVLWYVIYRILPICIIILVIVKRIIRLRDKKYNIYLIIGVVIYLITLIMLPIVSNKYIKDFTTEKWIKYKYDRKLMLNDLYEKYNLQCMSTDDINKLLGEPDTESECDIEYVISKTWIDPEMLVLRFEGDYVVDVYTYSEFKPDK